MSNKAPSLFDDFFFEEEKKEELFPDVPHVYDPGQNKENLEREKIEDEEQNIPPNPITKEAEFPEETGSNLTDEERDAEPEKIQKLSPEPSLLNIKKPSLELPIISDLEQQITQEGIQSDYFGFIHKDLPFNPIAIETVEKKSLPHSDPEKRQETITTQEKIKELEPVAEEEEEEEKVAPFPQWELKKNYYSIGEVAKLFEVNISHIRFWTNEFKLNPRTNRKGDRLYSPEQINELRLIHYLVKVKKHTIKGAKEKLKNQKITVENNLGLKESLVDLRDFLVSLKEELNKE